VFGDIGHHRRQRGEHRSGVRRLDRRRRRIRFRPLLRVGQNDRPEKIGREIVKAGNTKGGCITVPLTSCLTSLDWSVLQIKTKIVTCHTADSKPVKQEVNGTVILPPLVFPGLSSGQVSQGNPMFQCKARVCSSGALKEQARSLAQHC